jgi:hypothetical protein
MTLIVSAGVKYGVLQGQILKSKELYRVVPQMKGLDEHFPNQLKFWRYDVIWWRNNVKSFSKRNKTHLFTPCVHVCLNVGMWVDAWPNGEPESMHARMWGGLLQDTVSPIMGDMVHLFVCLSDCLSICLSVGLSVCLYSGPCTLTIFFILEMRKIIINATICLQ